MCAKQLFVVVVVAVAVAVVSGQRRTECPEVCPELHQCPFGRDQCPWGAVRDACGCCFQCAKGPNEACGEIEGRCGPGMKCQDINQQGVGTCKRTPFIPLSPLGSG